MDDYTAVLIDRYRDIERKVGLAKEFCVVKLEDLVLDAKMQDIDAEDKAERIAALEEGLQTIYTMRGEDKLIAKICTELLKDVY